MRTDLHISGRSESCDELCVMRTKVAALATSSEIYIMQISPHDLNRVSVKYSVRDGPESGVSYGECEESRGSCHVVA